MLLVGMLNFESELAHALEAARLAPPGTAMAVSAQCDPGLYDIAELGRAATLAGNPAIPLVKALTRPNRRNGSISARPART
jgi:3-carboxy-cis,cis-muconate cycloisomerase